MSRGRFRKEGAGDEHLVTARGKSGAQEPIETPENGKDHVIDLRGEKMVPNPTGEYVESAKFKLHVVS